MNTARSIRSQRPSSSAPCKLRWQSTSVTPRIIPSHDTGNTRNGKSHKTLKGEFGELPIDIPRDRLGSFEPQLIPKHQIRWSGFDEKILSLYACGMPVREIQAHLEEMYGVEVSPTLISTVTDAVIEEVKTWQSRPLEVLYPIVYRDCIHAKLRDTGAVRTKAVYLALGSCVSCLWCATA